MSRPGLRRIAFFALLFAAGLVVLALLRERRERPLPKGAPPERVEEAPFAEVPLPADVEGEGEGGKVGVFLRGPLEARELEGTGLLRRSLRAADVQPQGGDLYEFVDLDIEIDDRASGERVVRIESPRSRMRMPLRDGRPSIGEEDEFELQDARITLSRGVPLVPLTLRTPLLYWRPNAGAFRSPEAVLISGSGLEASSRGFEASTESEALRLSREGWIRVTLPGRGEASLRATGGGAITIARAPGPAPEEAELLELRIEDGAELRLPRGEGEGAGRTMEVDSRELVVRGLRREGEPGTDARTSFELVSAVASGSVVAESEDERFEAERAELAFGTAGAASGRLTGAALTGGVSMRSDAGSFRGRSAHLEFDERGRIARGTLEGEPSGDLPVGRHLPRGRAPAGTSEEALLAARAQISGAGPLAVELGSPVRFSLAGPATLAVPELGWKLSAASSLAGTVDEEAQRGTLDARGDVQADYGGRRLASEALELEYSIDPAGAAQVETRSAGRTAVEGEFEGRTVSLVALEGLQAKAGGSGFSIPLARGVEITLQGEPGFHATAAEIRDFDWERRLFDARGGVTYEDFEGRGQADRVVSRGPGERALYGKPGAPATYEFSRTLARAGTARANARAQEIEIRADGIDASGDAYAELALEDERYELAASRLSVRQEGEAAGGAQPWRLSGEEGVSIVLSGAEGRTAISCDELEVDATITGPLDLEQDVAVEVGDIRAEGDVRVDYLSEASVRGEGDRLTLDRSRRGHLSAGEGRRVRATIQVSTQAWPYAIEADWIDFSPDHVEASRVEVDLEDKECLPELQDVEEPVLLGMKAEHFVADRGRVRLEGDAFVRGRTPQGEVWSVEAGAIEVAGRWAEGGGFTLSDLESLHASGGFQAKLGTRGRAAGETLEGSLERLRIEGRPATLEYLDSVWESNWIEYDAGHFLLATDRGRLRSRDEELPTSWSIQYESLQPFAQGETTILVLRNPVMRQEATVVRADWMLFWVNRTEWLKSGERAIKESVYGPDLRRTTPEEPPTAVPDAQSDDPREVIASVRAHPLARVLGEIYVEGNVEFLDAQERVARASRIYLDVADGRGWVEDADVVLAVDVRRREQALRAKAKWMRIGADGSLRASDAVITSCEFDEPHYVVETGDLRIKWSPGRGLDFDVAARSNRLRFQNGFQIPLPPLVYERDDQGNSFIENFTAGDSSRFGTSVRASFNVALGRIGRGIGDVIGRVLDFPTERLKGHWNYDARWLGSRGVLLGVGLEFDVEDAAGRDLFGLELEVGGIPDGRADKGYVRVDPDDRQIFRTWLRGRGRYVLGPEEWFDLALSTQSDPGVQSEFFERRYVRYEEYENYLHWRKAVDEDYFSASAKVVLEDRTDVEELPSFGFFHGRTPIGSLGSLPLLYQASADVAYLRRVESDFDFDPPFPPGHAPFPDRLGEREVLRLDTEHRLEAPFPVGWAAIRGTPWIAARGTAWDRGVDEEEEVVRGGLFAGVDFSTTLWKRFSGGSVHAISPVLGLRSHVVAEESSGVPVTFDEVEDPIEGRFVELGVRSRLWRPQTKELFDVEVRSAWATDLGERGPIGGPDGPIVYFDDVPTGVLTNDPEGLQPIAVLSELLTFIDDVPVAFAHDGRYDTRGDGVVYARSSLGFEPATRFGLEFGHTRGLDPFGEKLFEAASVAARWRATPKWEFEVSQTVSLLDDANLDNEFVVRRIGHDFIMEIEVGYRAGEGADFSLGVNPELTWRRSALGLIDRLLGRDR